MGISATKTCGFNRHDRHLERQVNGPARHPSRRRSEREAATKKRVLLCWLAGLLLLISTSNAEDESQDTTYQDSSARERLLRSLPLSKRPRAELPNDEELMRRNAVIGEIYIETQDIFDPTEPGEDRMVYRIANRLHVTTRPSVVERQLLFESGDPYDPRQLREAARRLRSLDFLHDARVMPIAYDGNRVDVLVVTRDVWTLGMGAGFERSGGDNVFQVNLEDGNLLGSGRFIDLKYADDVDRSSMRFRFVDPALLGTRAELRLWYADNSDGYRRVFDLARPFFALDSRWGASGKWISDQRTEKIYRSGAVIDRFHHDKTFVEISGGLSRGLIEDKTRRWRLGYTFEEDRFIAFEDPAYRNKLIDDDELVDPFLKTNRLPENRTLSYLWLGFEKVEDGFVEVNNMDQIGRTEDFNLGHELRARLGWSASWLGGDSDRAIFDLSSRWGWQMGTRQTLLVESHANGRWGEEGAENVVLGGELRYFRRIWGPHQFIVTARFDSGWELDPERQLLLGGESGLRGYPTRFQDGDQRFLVSLEQRFYTDWELFKLVRVGAAAFFDVGRAWYQDEDRFRNFSDLGVLKDIGLGLRLSSSRSSRGQMIHLDVAFPLDGDDREVQWLVTSQRSF